MSLRDLLRVVNRHKTLIAVIVAICTLSVLVYQLFSTPMYRSTAQVQIELIDAVGVNQADVDSRNAQRVANAVRLHRSRSAAERVIADLDLLHDPDFLREVGQPRLQGDQLKYAAISKLLSMLSIAAEPNSDLLVISVTSTSPELSAKIANQFPASVRAVRNVKGDERRDQLLASLEEEQHKRGVAASEAAKKVADFRSENHMLVGAGGADDLAQFNLIAAQAASANAMRDGSAARSGGIASAAGIQSTATASSAALQQLERQYAELISERSRLTSSYGPNHPDVQRVTSQLATVQSNMEVEREKARSAAMQVARADAARTTQMARSEAARDAAQAARLNGIMAAMEGQA
ncbi:MAG: Wzz/FepE/Etk N-terminal domain-containing protein, partial [Novosphingobium sp.]|nr:Wzz/FepE/Etk N-terminal domain-containing protein [Novosphingobium sp.]